MSPLLPYAVKNWLLIRDLHNPPKTAGFKRHGVFRIVWQIDASAVNPIPYEISGGFNIAEYEEA